jgi:hypothetical protein
MPGLVLTPFRSASPALRLLFAVIVAASSTTSRAAAGTDPCGFPVAVEAERQSTPVIVPDGAGGTYVAWADTRSGARAAYITRLDPSGDPAFGWPVNGLSLGATGLGPSLALNVDGGALVVATQGGKIIVHRLTPTGDIHAGWPASGAVAHDYMATVGLTEIDVANDGSGGAYVGWSIFGRTWRAYGYSRIQRVSAAGVPMWADALWTIDREEPSSLWLFPNGAGAAQVANFFPFYSAEVYAFMVQPTGSASPTRYLHTMPNLSCLAHGATAVSNGSGGMLVLWQQFCTPAIHAVQLDASGAFVPGWGPSKLIASADGSAAACIAPDGSGGALSAWIDPAGLPRMVRHDAAGALAPGWPADGRLLSTRPVSYVEIAPDGSGGAFAAWYRKESDNTWTLVGQHALADGSLSDGYGADGKSLCTQAEPQPLALTAASPGRATGIRTDGPSTNRDLYGFHLQPDGVTSTRLVAVRSNIASGRVTVVWETSGDDVRQRFDVERSRNGTAWNAVGTQALDRDGRLVYDDADVLAGTRYGYRLREVGAAEPWSATEVWVDVPARTALAIRGAGTGASGSSLELTVALASRGAALALFDVTGRRLFDQDLDLDAGEHQVEISLPVRLRAGLYLTEIRQGDARAVRRFVHAP